MMQKILTLDPATYHPHRIHTQDRDWAETNCYVDIWIELLHAHGHEPIAAMPFTLTIDFEGDQWTFFKFPLADLYELYGIDVQELAIWKPLIRHIEEQVMLGRPVLVELDSFYLPDTAGMAYKIAHVKTTVAVNEIDIDKRHLGYFHGQGYYHLNGDDFDEIFHLRGEANPAMLAPYVEIAKLGKNRVSKTTSMVDSSVLLLRRQIEFIPHVNPFSVFKDSLQRDLDWLLNEPLDTFHLYSFATFRQFGACFELAANYLLWLQAQGEKGLTQVIEDIKSISEMSKVYQFQLARAITRKKPLDLTPVDEMGAKWMSATKQLKNKYL